MTNESERPNWISLTDAHLENSPDGYWNVVDCSVIPADEDFNMDIFDGKDTGLCIWTVNPNADDLFKLEFRSAGNLLRGRMAIWHSDASFDLSTLKQPKTLANGDISAMAMEAVRTEKIELLAEAINRANSLQLEMGMPTLPSALNALAYKYTGNMNYALYLFKEKSDRDSFCAKSGALAVEPYYSQ